MKNAITIVRMLDAPRAKVWRALSEPEALKLWWGMPTGASMPVCKVDFRLGGDLLCQISHDGALLWFKWTYREIVPQARLVMAQHASDAEGRALDTPERPESTVTITLEDAAGRTKLTVHHAGMASEVYPAGAFEAGWGQSLDRLGASLAQS